eukprot:c35561_g1_i1 orf=3-449(+)
MSKSWGNEWGFLWFAKFYNDCYTSLVCCSLALAPCFFDFGQLLPVLEVVEGELLCPQIDVPFNARACSSTWIFSSKEVHNIEMCLPFTSIMPGSPMLTERMVHITLRLISSCSGKYLLLAISSGLRIFTSCHPLCSPPTWMYLVSPVL